MLAILLSPLSGLSAPIIPTFIILGLLLLDYNHIKHHKEVSVIFIDRILAKSSLALSLVTSSRNTANIVSDPGIVPRIYDAWLMSISYASPEA